MSSKVMGLMPGKWGFLQGELTPLSHPTTPTTLTRPPPPPHLCTKALQAWTRGLTLCRAPG